MEIKKHKKLEWKHIKNPNRKVLEEIKGEYGFHKLDIEDCVSDSQRSKIDIYDDYIFMILHFPNKKKNKNYLQIGEVGIFLGKDFVITISRSGHKVVDRVFKKLDPTKSMEKGSGYLLYEIIKDIFDSTFSCLDEIITKTKFLEKAVFKNKSFKSNNLQSILSLKKDIINFKRVIHPQIDLIRALEKVRNDFLDDSMEYYFDDILDRLHQISHSVNDNQEVINTLQDINESIISTNTNNIIRILTIVSVILMPLSVLSGIYGMNVVGLPLADNPIGFFAVAGVMLLIVLIMVSYFKYKDWI